MNERTFDLSSFVLSEDIPIIFKPDPDLGEEEQLEQAKQLAAFMTADKSDEPLLPFPPHQFVELLASSFSYKELHDMLFDDIYQATPQKVGLRTSREFRETMLGALNSTGVPIGVEYVIATHISRLFFDQGTIAKYFAKIRPQRKRKIAEHVTEVTLAKPSIETLQAQLILKLKERTSGFLDIARMLPYMAIGESQTQLSTQEFFGGEQIEDLSSYAHEARMQFGFLACHIGYRELPYFGKWEALYAKAHKLDLTQLLNFQRAERTDKQVISDLTDQLRAVSELYIHLVKEHKNILLSGEAALKEIELKGDEIAQLTERQVELEAQISGLQKELAAYRDNHEAMAAGIRNDIRAEFEQRYAGQQRKTGKEKKLARAKDRLQSQVTELENQVAEQSRALETQERYLAGYETRIAYLESKLAQATADPIYKVILDIKRSRERDFTQRHLDALEAAKQNLVDGTSQGISIRKEYGWAHARLKSSFPDCDNFRKYEGPNDFRVIYAHRNGNVIVIKDVMSHPEYMKRLCRKHR